MQLRQILAVLQKQNKYVTLQRHVARQLIQQRGPKAACDGAKCNKPCEKK